MQSLYPIGSHSDGSAGEASDLDVIVVLRDAVAEEERNTIRGISEHLSQLAGRHVDLLPATDRLLYPVAPPDLSEYFRGYVKGDKRGEPNLKVFVATVGLSRNVQSRVSWANARVT